MRTVLIVLGLAVISRLAAADVTGVWKAEFDTQVGIQKYTFTLKQDRAGTTSRCGATISIISPDACSGRRRR